MSDTAPARPDTAHGDLPRTDPSPAASSPTTPRPTEPARIDPRGPRLAASLTAVVLAAVLVLAPSPAALALLLVQTALFATGAAFGIRRTPYSWLFRRLVRPRLGPPSELEDARPPRFAQAVGLAFAIVALAGFGTGLTVLGLVATGLALAAAFLNAAFGFCLGCELYLLLRQVAPRVRVSGQEV